MKPCLIAILIAASASTVIVGSISYGLCQTGTHTPHLSHLFKRSADAKGRLQHRGGCLLCRLQRNLRDGRRFDSGPGGDSCV
ncbi:hypothetical protein OF83DRAFT_12220 [Amylostereum chailletii]|nr:hypothetical protein OF83DRAFT_12220 [Amylostereum chailletii]